MALSQDFTSLCFDEDVTHSALRIFILEWQLEHGMSNPASGKLKMSDSSARDANNQLSERSQMGANKFLCKSYLPVPVGASIMYNIGRLGNDGTDNRVEDGSLFDV